MLLQYLHKTQTTVILGLSMSASTSMVCYIFTLASYCLVFMQALGVLSSDPVISFTWFCSFSWSAYLNFWMIIILLGSCLFYYIIFWQTVTSFLFFSIWNIERFSSFFFLRRKKKNVKLWITVKFCIVLFVGFLFSLLPFFLLNSCWFDILFNFKFLDCYI